MLMPLAAEAQDTTRIPTGVELIGRYNVSKRPLIAVRPLVGSGGDVDVANTITSILRRDLDYSDRFEIGDVPASLASGPVDYRQWNSLNVWYLVTGTVTPSSEGYTLQLELHDVVYGNIKNSAAYTLP